MFRSAARARRMLRDCMHIFQGLAWFGSSNLLLCSGFSGIFGTGTRPIVLKIRDRLELNTRSIFKPVILPSAPPESSNNARLKFNPGGVLSAVSGSQVLQLGNPREADSAIFTDVRNDDEDIAIRLPADPLYEDGVVESVWGMVFVIGDALDENTAD